MSEFLSPPADAAIAAIVESAAREVVDDLRRIAARTGDFRDEDSAAELVARALQRCLDHLVTTGLWGKVNQLPSSRLWRIAGPLLEVGSLQLHARTKPRGYAGDYEMLTKICARFQCADPLGAAFDRYFQNQHAPGAVRNRTQFMAEVIVQERRRRGSEDCRVVSVGCGPAIDVRRALEILSPAERHGLRVALFDLDPAALDVARAALEPLLPADQISCERENLFRLPHRGRGAERLGPADLLFCTGLFDYLEENDAVAMLAMFWESLTPGGRLTVFNFAPDNPSRAYMEWIGNWYLLYRDRQQLQRLAERAGLNSGHFSVAAESLGVNLYIDARK